MHVQDVIYLESFHSLKDLRKKVKEHIDNGWELSGDLVFGDGYFYQRMVLLKPSELLNEEAS